MGGAELKSTFDMMKQGGFKEVKNGKFEEKYRFNHDDNVAQLNCQKPTN